MARLLADEQFPLSVVRALRGLGHDVLTVQGAGLSGAADPDVLTAATADGRAVLTHDRDYIRLHKRGAVHAGIVFASEDLNSAALAARIDAAIQANPDLTGQLIRVYRPSAPPPQVP